MAAMSDGYRADATTAADRLRDDAKGAHPVDGQGATVDAHIDRRHWRQRRSRRAAGLRSPQS